MEKYECFCGPECVNGSCPRALAYEHQRRDDDMLMQYEGMEKLKCKDCVYNAHDCKKCIFYDLGHCDLVKGSFDKN